MECYLGVDGGGSHTRALLVDANGNELHYGEAGPSNPNTVGLDGVETALRKLVEGCVSVSGSVPNGACFGLAGSGGKHVSDEISKIIQSFGFGNYILTTDAEIALEGAFTAGPGILLISGTGSVCFGKSHEGQIFRTGGHGWLVDDGGSAGWTGQRALEVAIRQSDGRMAGHGIKDAVFEKLEIRNNDEISTRIYQSGLGRAEIAELAPLIVELADKGDSAATEVRDAAIDELELLIRATSEKMAAPCQSIAVSGGMLEHSPTFLNALTSRLSDFHFQERGASPVRGAVAIAMRLGQSR